MNTCYRVVRIARKKCVGLATLHYRNAIALLLLSVSSNYTAYTVQCAIAVQCMDRLL